MYPFGKSVLSDIELEDREIYTLSDLVYYIPNVYFIDIDSAAATTIRGVSGEMGTMSSAVALYVNGIPLTNSPGFDIVMEDIERIEVLRGPQGRLYGKNAEAGVINVITKKPDNTFRGKLGAVLGEDKRQEANLYLPPHHER